MASIVSLARPNIEASTPSRFDRSPTLTATTRPAPIALTTSAGTLFMAPPSTSIRPSTSTGGKASGSDIVARSASASEPLRMHHGLCRQQIDGHRSKRRRQLVEVLDVEIGTGNARQHQFHRLAVVQRGRRHDAAAFQPELEPRRIRSRVGLAADVLVFERRGAEELVPVDGIDERLQFVGIHPGGERSADQSSHARARRHVDRNAVLLQPPDHADVRDAAGAAPSECDAHSRRRAVLTAAAGAGPLARRGWRGRRRALQGRCAGRT